MKNVVFWDIKSQFVPHRKHIMSQLQLRFHGSDWKMPSSGMWHHLDLVRISSSGECVTPKTSVLMTHTTLRPRRWYSSWCRKASGLEQVLTLVEGHELLVIVFGLLCFETHSLDWHNLSLSLGCDFALNGIWDVEVKVQSLKPVVEGGYVSLQVTPSVAVQAYHH
jgi:hypothetical protein